MADAVIMVLGEDRFPGTSALLPKGMFMALWSTEEFARLMLETGDSLGSSTSREAYVFFRVEDFPYDHVRARRHLNNGDGTFRFSLDIPAINAAMPQGAKDKIQKMLSTEETLLSDIITVPWVTFEPFVLDGGEPV